jgi:hypothetical protein
MSTSCLILTVGSFARHRFLNRAIFPVFMGAFGFYSGSAFERLFQHVQLLVQFGHLLALAANFAHRMQHGGVVAATKQFSDFGRLFCVNSLARYMAIWRGRAMLAGRFLEYMSAILIL